MPAVALNTVRRLQIKKSLYIFPAATKSQPVRSLTKTLVQNAPAEKRAEKAIEQIYRRVSRYYPTLSVAAKDALIRKLLQQLGKEAV